MHQPGDPRPKLELLSFLTHPADLPPKADPKPVVKKAFGR
jgi:hypothetical protein